MFRFRVWMAFLMLALPGISLAQDSDGPRWVLRSKHFVYGMPKLTRDFSFTPEGEDEQQPGISVLVREGFVVAHHDKFKAPLWVSMQWSRANLRASGQLVTLPRDFKMDYELPRHARGGTSYNGNQVAPPYGSLKLPDTQFNLPTTDSGLGPGGSFSHRFADNVGPDDTIVFRGSLQFDCTAPPTEYPKPWERVVDLQTPFQYNPEAGNLIVDVRDYEADYQDIHFDHAHSGAGLLAPGTQVAARISELTAEHPGSDCFMPDTR